MKSAFVKVLIVLAGPWFTVCHSDPAQNITITEQSPTAPARQELELTTDPWFDAPPHGFHLSWAKVSQNNKRYRLALPKDFRLPEPRPFQFGSLNEYFVIAIDKQAKEGSPYKLLAMYATDSKRWNYQPHWITCDHDLSITKLYNSTIGVVAVEFLEAGGHNVSALKWDEGRKTFTCVDVGSRSLIFP